MDEHATELKAEDRVVKPVSDPQRADMAGYLSSQVMRSVLALLPPEMDFMLEHKSDIGRGLNDLLVKFYQRAQDAFFVPMLKRERQILKDFFGSQHEGSDFVTNAIRLFRQKIYAYGLERVEKWSVLGFEPHVLPAVAMEPDAKFPGWAIRLGEPNSETVDSILAYRNAAGDNVIDLSGYDQPIVVLVDMHDYHTGGRRPVLGSLMQQLRGGQFIKWDNTVPMESMCGVAEYDWLQHVRPAVANAIGLPDSVPRLERAIEWHYLAQAMLNTPRVKDRNGGFGFMLGEYYPDGENVLVGGKGGLSTVESHSTGEIMADVALRCIIEL